MKDMDGRAAIWIAGSRGGLVFLRQGSERVQWLQWPLEAPDDRAVIQTKGVSVGRPDSGGMAMKDPANVFVVGVLVAFISFIVWIKLAGDKQEKEQKPEPGRSAREEK